MRSSPLILGINASHNGAACLIKGTEIVVAVQEERLSRQKRDRIYGISPARCISYCLGAAGIAPDQLDAVVLTCQQRRSSRLNDLTRNPIFRRLAREVRIFFLPNHAAHAIATFVASGFDEAAVLVADGMGSPCADFLPTEVAAYGKVDPGSSEIVSIYHADSSLLTCIAKHCVSDSKWLVEDHGCYTFGSIGGLYSAVAGKLFGDTTAAGKVMGLAAYGTPCVPISEFVNFLDNGAIKFNNTALQRFGDLQNWRTSFGEAAILAASAQAAVESSVCKLALDALSRTGLNKLCYSGGVALNCVANERLASLIGEDHLFVLPAAEDNGAAIGAAYWGLRQLTGRFQCEKYGSDALGRSYSEPEWQNAALNEGCVLEKHSDTIREAAQRLMSGQVLGVFSQGSEFGPRALGNRSLVADPRKSALRDHINLVVKKRENFRPLAPAILTPQASEWFDIKANKTAESPFMLRSLAVNARARERAPAVVHADGTARVQTVAEDSPHLLHQLVSEFHRQTGVPILINTSFNGHDEPIVETPADAIQCMHRNHIGAIVTDHGLLLPTQN